MRILFSALILSFFFVHPLYAEDTVLFREDSLPFVLSYDQTDGVERAFRLRTREGTPHAHMRLSAPDRIVVDFDGQYKGDVHRSIDSLTSDLVREVRVGSYPDRLRVVFELYPQKIGKHIVEADGSDVLVRFYPRKSIPIPQPIAPSVAQDEPLPTEQLPPQDRAGFSLDRVYLRFQKHERKVADILVQSEQTEPIYVETTVQEVVEPGAASESRVATRKILVSPKRFQLPAGKQKRIRVVLPSGVGKKEQIFRISFVPIKKSFDDALVYLKNGGAPEKLKLVFGLGVLVVADPDEPIPDWLWEREGDLIRFYNSGNTNIYLDKITVRDLSQKRSFVLPSKRLYPGNRWELKVPKTAQFECMKSVLGGFERVIIPVEAR